VETLIPDFQGSKEGVSKVLDSQPEVISHNIETVPRLYPETRPEADYQQSLDVLGLIKEKKYGILSKSGLMLGLGETQTEVLDVMKDLKNISCDFITIGQYLQPTRKHLPVKRYVPPEEFVFYHNKAKEMNFRSVMSGPFVRSSYKASI